MGQNLSKSKHISYLLAGILFILALTGCSEQKTTKPKATPVPTPKELVSQEDPNSNLGQWGRAMGSVLIAMNEGNVYYFGGYETTEENRKAAARILKQSWNINNRTDLLVQIQNLLKTGDRKGYRKEAKEMRSMSKKALKTALKQLSGETLTHYEMVQYNWNKWKKKGLLAWDLCRVSHLVQWGYVAGYLNVTEAQALIAPAATELQNNFGNWDEVQQNWLDGYALFAAIDAGNPAGTDYEKRQKIYEELKAAQEQNGVLYDDSLFQKEVILISGVDAESLLKEAAVGAASKKPAATESAVSETKKPKGDKPEKSSDKAELEG